MVFSFQALFIFFFSCTTVRVKQPIGNVSSQIRKEETTKNDVMRGRTEKRLAGQQTFFHGGLLGPSTLQAEDSTSLSVSKQIKTDEKPDSSVSSVGAKISMSPLSDGNKTEEELHDDRSVSTNAKSVVRFDIGCITDDVPTQAEKKNYHRTHPTTQTTFKSPGQWSLSRNYYEHLWYWWRNVQERAYCFESIDTSTILFACCRMVWYTTGVVSSRYALASPGGWTASTKWRKIGVRLREHENCKSHMEWYIAWRELERRLLSK